MYSKKSIYIGSLEINDEFRRRGLAEQSIRLLVSKLIEARINIIRFRIFNSNTPIVNFSKKFDCEPVELLLQKFT